jgi:hypothetical protein
MQRKVLALLQYVLAKQPADAAAAAQASVVAPLQQLVLSTAAGGGDMRAAALAVLAEVLATPQGWAWVREHDGCGRLHSGLEQLTAGAASEGGEDETERELRARVVGLLAAPTPPAAKARGLQDHIDLDPYQDGRERAEPQSLPLAHGGGGGSGGGGSGATAAPAPSGLALMAAPRPELR